jgi:predicted metal-binding membrane protein
MTMSGSVTSFLGTWIVMTAAMMLPSLVPMLWRYRRAVAATRPLRLGWLTAVVSAGYFAVWTALGLTVFPASTAMMAVQMRQPAIASIIAGVVVVLAGVLQFSAWKARHLACCREDPGPGRVLPPDSGAAWRHGLRLGVHCVCSCAGLTAILLALGIMDARVMAVVTTAITLERLASSGETAAQAIGAGAAAAGLVLIARAAGLA